MITRLIQTAGIALLAIGWLGCQTRIPKPYTIQGRDPKEWVLYTPTGAKTKRVDLPPGLYYPGILWDGFGFGSRTYFQVYMAPGGLTEKGLLGEAVAGGISLQLDPLPPEPKLYYFRSSGGASGDLPPGFRYKLLSRVELMGLDGTTEVNRETQRHFQRQMLRSLPPTRVR